MEISTTTICSSQSCFNFDEGKCAKLGTDIAGLKSLVTTRLYSNPVSSNIYQRGYSNQNLSMSLEQPSNINQLNDIEGVLYHSTSFISSFI